jgi:hypothetical protein
MSLFGGIADVASPFVQLLIKIAGKIFFYGPSQTAWVFGVVQESVPALDHVIAKRTDVSGNSWQAEAVR